MMFYWFLKYFYVMKKRYDQKATPRDKSYQSNFDKRLSDFDSFLVI